MPTLTDSHKSPDFDEKLDTMQSLLITEMYKGLLDNLNGLKGFLHPIQLTLNFYSMVRHPMTTIKRAATFAWNNKIRTLTGLGLNILEGQLIGSVIGSATSAAESSEMFFNNTTMTASAESALPTFIVEAEQLASNVVSGAGHACSGGVCTMPAATSVSFFPAPIITTGPRQTIQAQNQPEEPALQRNLNLVPRYF